MVACFLVGFSATATAGAGAGSSMPWRSSPRFFRAHLPEVENATATERAAAENEWREFMTDAWLVANHQWDAAIENSQRGALRKQAEKDAREEENRRARPEQIRSKHSRRSVSQKSRFEILAAMWSAASQRN